MLKNRFMVAFAFAGLLGFAACGGGEEEAAEEPVVEEPAPAAEPAPAPMPAATDTAAMPMDTGAAAADTSGV